MRLWRKTHGAILSSDKIAEVSDAAALLFFMLIPAQDDSGRYPWTTANIKSLCLTRDWTVAQADQYMDELVLVGLVIRAEKHVILARGEEQNGQPSSSPKYRFLYPICESEMDRSLTGQLVVSDDSVTDQLPVTYRVEESREEQSRESVGSASDLPSSLSKWQEQMAMTDLVNDRVALLVDLARKHWDGNPEIISGGKAAQILKQSNNAYEAVKTVWDACASPNARGDVFEYALGIQKNRKEIRYGKSGSHSATNRSTVYRRTPSL
jgi:hypothetical protein